MALIARGYQTPEVVENLGLIKNRMKQIYSQVTPQYDDIEAEIVCLLLLQIHPQIVHDVSLNGVWSTLYMLNALDLTSQGVIHSYDKEPQTARVIEMFPNLKKRWIPMSLSLPTSDENIEFLFIDADHSQEFAHTYVDQLLTPLLNKVRQSHTKVMVVVHDIFHAWYEQQYQFNPEGQVLIDFLERNQLLYFSPRNYEHAAQLNQERIQAKIDTSPIHCYSTNPAVFFILE